MALSQEPESLHDAGHGTGGGPCDPDNLPCGEAAGGKAFYQKIPILVCKEGMIRIIIKFIACC